MLVFPLLTPDAFERIMCEESSQTAATITSITGFLWWAIVESALFRPSGLKGERRLTIPVMAGTTSKR